ncbi:amidohydrolase [Actinomadura scrupuli]|uniref:amidohydrolase n=1 Tax=Actinomadura scrupuli TaxID=559629 RepID=UPI003D995281
MDHADLVFTGGAVHTVDPRHPRASAVAVRNGRIVAVDQGVTELTGPRTEVVDLRGGALIPGFQDAHVHPAFAGVALLGCDLSAAGSAEEALSLIAAYAAAHPDAEWIIGGGWYMEWFPGGTPGKELLDGVVPDRPAYFTNRDVHGSWANSAALRLAGVDRHTPDPADGRIERTADGDPQGTLHEGAALLVTRVTPQPTFQERLAGLLAGQAHLHALGITAWQDAIIGDYLGNVDPYDVYLTAAREGTLTARVVGALWWDRERDGTQIDGLLERRANGTAGRFRATTVKIMQDGVAENFTAGMIDPYFDGCGCRTARSGLSYVDPGALREYAAELDAHGFQLHFHAIGDRAVRESLDAVAAAVAANGRNGHRHHIAHLQVVHPDDVPRFAELGVTANMQPLWATHEPQMDELTIPFLGPERASWQYPWADLRASGARLAAGSDWSVSSANPLEGIHVAVNRAEPGTTGPAFLPDQRLDLATALHAYTMGSAYVNHLDQETGSIEVGKLADLAVLDRDPFAGPAEEIAATRVLQTFVEGERVHGA